MTLLPVAHVLAVWLVMHAERPAPEDFAGWLGSGRIVDRECLHVGARPSTDGSGIAVSVQVTFCSP